MFLASLACNYQLSVGKSRLGDEACNVARGQFFGRKQPSHTEGVDK